MSDAPIGFFDSGLGGISVLRRAKQVLPNENFIYFGDSENAPYGNKSREEVLALVNAAVDFLLQKNIKALVVACNTATSVAIEHLRNSLSIPIISMEPAIKPALEQTDKNVLLLATRTTLNSERVKNLMRKYDTENRVICAPNYDLARRIENQLTSEQNLDEYLREYLLPYKDKNISAIVLGCTHYPFVKKRIEQIYPEAKFFDGIDGTVNHLKKILEENGLLSDNKDGKIEFYSSKAGKEKIFDILFSGGTV